MQRIACLKFGDMKMPCDLREVLQRQYYFFGTYFLEESILDAWCELARGADVVFDVGANGGIYSLAALATQPSAIVHAFEPTPEIADRLRHAADMNGRDRLIVHQAAVSSWNGRAILRRCGTDVGGNEGMNFIVPDGDGEDVQVMTLDHACAELGVTQIDLLKLDVQGCEADALDGARKLLGAGRIKTIFMELNFGWGGDHGCPATKSLDILSDAGFEFSAPQRPMNWRPRGEWLRECSDVICRLQHRA